MTATDDPAELFAGLGSAVSEFTVATFTNDRFPRSGQPWTCEGIVIKRGATVGAGAVVLPGTTIGERAMVGAGAVVTKDVEPDTLVVGNPARVGRRLESFPT